MKTMHILDMSDYVLFSARGRRVTSYINLSGSTVLGMTDFGSDAAAKDFMDRAKTASHLPHPVYSPAVLLTDAQAAAIAQQAALFPEATTPAQRLAIAKTLNTAQVARRAARIHPHMALSVWA